MRIWKYITTKRVLASLLILLFVLVFVMELVSRRDAARTEHEQYGVYSAYLFSVPVVEKPLPVECREDPKFTRGEGIVEIRQYFVSDQTISGFSQPHTFWHVPREKMAVRFVPTSVFGSFVVRNLSTEKLTTTNLYDSNGRRPELVHGSPDILPAEQLTISVRLTKVGFNRDFTSAMFYAEVSCGEASGKEYVYLEKVPYGRKFWYWYVVRVDRK
jgi:hypothetical protein